MALDTVASCVGLSRQGFGRKLAEALVQPLDFIRNPRELRDISPGLGTQLAEFIDEVFAFSWSGRSWLCHARKSIPPVFSDVWDKENAMGGGAARPSAGCVVGSAPKLLASAPRAASLPFSYP